MSKLNDAADALQALEKLRQALRSPIGTVVAGVAHEVAQGSTLTDAISKHVNVTIAGTKGGPVTIGDIIDSIFGTESEGGAPRPEAEGAGEARSEETATMFPEQHLQGKKKNSNP